MKYTASNTRKLLIILKKRIDGGDIIQVVTANATIY
jgi:hypothetical protein